MSLPRVGIDVHSIGSKKGGNDRYYRELVIGLSKLPTNYNFLLYYTGPKASVEMPLPGNFRFEPMWPANPLLRIPAVLPVKTRMDKLDVFHAQFIIPPFLACKTVVSILDLTYEHYPQFFPASQRTWMKTAIPWSAKHADHVITLSQHAKADIMRTYGVPEQKVTVTSLAAASEFVPGNRKEAKAIIANKYGISRDFILYLGRLQARKNLSRLVEAYNDLKKVGFSHKLVLAGKPDFFFESVKNLIRELKLQDDVILPGYVPAEDVPTFYNAAEVFVFPSFYEGFGLPVVEAMACGTPVITSIGSSLEEVAGDAALLVDPMDQVALLQALRQVLEDSALRLRLSAAGLQRSKQFDFQSAARNTLAVYESLAG